MPQDPQLSITALRWRQNRHTLRILLAWSPLTCALSLLYWWSPRFRTSQNADDEGEKIALRITQLTSRTSWIWVIRAFCSAAHIARSFWSLKVLNLETMATLSSFLATERAYLFLVTEKISEMSCSCAWKQITFHRRDQWFSIHVLRNPIIAWP